MSGILFDNWNLEEVSYMQYHSKERGERNIQTEYGICRSAECVYVVG